MSSASNPPPTARLEGKVAIITGGASGIGEAATRLFVRHGAAVVVADVQDELGRQVVASMGSWRERVRYRRCDVREEEQVAETVRYAVREFGRLDVMVSNAGTIEPYASILDLDMAALERAMATNVRGVAATIKHAARAMVAQGVRGSIICTGSVAGCLGGSGPHEYTASKHAVVGLVRSACSELGRRGIRVNCISPFGVATPLACAVYGQEPREVEQACGEAANLKGLVLRADHVAEAALFLASDESAYVSGLNLTVDGGVSVVAHLCRSPT
ncbi:short-chain dehydrogenase reductase 3b-like [Andrographis paniculata]|uniref:short-chain dehydrogenase reductase 3b-like n=1 Tax=Andrographis paniculata TaxID=175694 RepID=UPI0021E893B8|nr:short-chain dehydrogenase reductase 3b-like [Andrographis paniculata]